MKNAQHSLAAAFNTATGRALQWRLLVLWLVAQAVPLVLACVPLWLSLGAVLDHSLLARELADGAGLVVLAETLTALGQRGWAMNSGIAGALLLAMLLPWLAGTLVAAARSPVRLGFGSLVKGGLQEYGRMARLWLWALIPLGLAMAAGGGLAALAKHLGEKAVLETTWDNYRLAAIVLGAALLLLALATQDAARAQLVLEPRRRSVVRAWFRGSIDLFKDPRRLFLYLALTVVGLLLAAVFGWVRVQVPAVGPIGVGLALVLGQLVVLALAWMRMARFFGLIAAGRSASSVVA